MRTTLQTSFFLILVMLALNLNAQIAINTTGALPVASSMLDITSTTSGLLIPRMTQAQRIVIAAPATSLIVYQTDAPTGYWYYNGTVWVRLYSGSGDAWDINGNTGTSSLVNFIGTTDNMDITFRTNNTDRSYIFADGSQYSLSSAIAWDAVEMDAPNGMVGGVGALWTINPAPAANGGGYGAASANYSILGMIAGTRTYSFGVMGQVSTGSRSGALFGLAGNATAWASIGYRANNNSYYGLYYTSAGTGAGKSIDAKSDVGMGGYSSLLGGWIKSELYGLNIKGSRYSLYTDGRQFSNDIITVLSENENSNNRIATYVTTSANVDVIDRGISTIINGETTLNFNKSFSDIVSENNPIIVTVTPIGRSASIYIDNTTKSGFKVKTDNNTYDKSIPLQFSWIAIGTRKGYENPQTPSELLSKEYDSNMNEIMVNENDVNASAKQMWWDGEKLNFGTMPESYNNQEDSRILKSIIPNKKLRLNSTNN